MFAGSRSAGRRAGAPAVKDASRMASVLLACALVAAALALAISSVKPAAAADPPPTAHITVVPHDLASHAALGQFTYIVNVDNAHTDPAPQRKTSSKSLISW